MLLKALTDILHDCKKYKAGSVFETSADHGQYLVELGWAEAVKEEKPKKAKATKKK